MFLFFKIISYLILFLLLNYLLCVLEVKHNIEMKRIIAIILFLIAIRKFRTQEITTKEDMFSVVCKLVDILL